MSFLKNTKVFWVVLVLVFSISRLATWLYPFGSDHWFFYYIGRDIVEGGTLYITSWDHKGPLIFYFNSLLYILFGQNLILHRIFLTVLGVLDTFLFYLLSKKLFEIKNEKLKIKNETRTLAVEIEDKKVNSWELGVENEKDNYGSGLFYARLATVCYAFWRNLSQYTSSGNNNENLGIIFLILAYLSFIIFFQKRNLLYLLASGFYISFLAILKMNFLILTLPLFLEILFLHRKNFFKIISSGLVLILPVGVHLGLWIWYFSSRGTLKDYYIAAFGYNSVYWRAALSNSFGNLRDFIILSLPLLLPFLLVFLAQTICWFYPLKKFPENFKNFSKPDNFKQRFIYFIAGSGLLFSVLSGTFFTYYFLVVIPGFILILVLYFKNNEAGFNFKKFSSLNKGLAVLLVLCILAAAGISTRQAYNTFRGSSSILDSQTQEIGDYLNQNTTKEDTIISYMYGPTLYIQADRKAGTRFTSGSFMLLDNKYKFGFSFNKIFIEDLEKSKSKYLVLPTDKKNSYYQNTELVDYFKIHYKFEKSFEDFEVWRRVG